MRNSQKYYVISKDQRNTVKQVNFASVCDITQREEVMEHYKNQYTEQKNLILASKGAKKISAYISEHKENKPNLQNSPKASEKAGDIETELNAEEETEIKTSKKAKKSLECSFCSKAFQLRNEMIKHERTHAGEEPYKCAFCEKQFKLRCLWQEHKALHGEAKFQCESCPLKFHTKNILQKHVMNQHTADKPCMYVSKIPCDTCDAIFNSLNDLKMHKMSKHSGDKPFKCDQCYKDFLEWKEFNRHMRVHKRDNELYNCCKICPKKFGGEDWLKLHYEVYHKIANPENTELL